MPLDYFESILIEETKLDLNDKKKYQREYKTVVFLKFEKCVAC